MRRLQQPALVVVEGGRPERVNWSSVDARRAKSSSGGRVRRVIDEWRVDSRWWTREIRRDYYLLELEGGQLVEVYREGEGWCVTGVAD